MVKNWREDIQLFSTAIKKISTRKFAVMQQPGSVVLVPLRERDLARRVINGELDASGKSPAYSHGRNNQPAPGNRQRAFL